MEDIDENEDSLSGVLDMQVSFNLNKFCLIFVA